MGRRREADGGVAWEKTGKPLGACAPRGFLSSVGCGGVLLSHTLSGAVPSPCQALASGFGMGPGVSPGPWPPQESSYTVRHNGLPAVWRFGNRRMDASMLCCSVRCVWEAGCRLPVVIALCGCGTVPHPLGWDVVWRSPVSTGRLHPSRGFHVRPIDHVFCMGGHQAMKGL